MTDSSQAHGARLDSWKAISDYLGRDERTVRRWEKDLALPIRRVPGRRGHSVFAYVAEIDAWLQKVPPVQAGKPPREAQPDLRTHDAESPARASDARPWHSFTRSVWQRNRIVAVAVLLLVVLAEAWRGLAAGRTIARARMVSGAVIATNRADVEVWRYAFPAGEVASPPSQDAIMVPADPRTAGVYAMVGGRVRTSDSVRLGGQLLWFGPDGALRAQRALADETRFGDASFGAPWDVIDGRLDERGSVRIAIAAHHDTWWPGLVTVFDAALQRRGSFVNAGWVEAVRWLAPDRLVASGFSNARDGGMVTLLDTNALDGRSPEPVGSTFHCDSCGPNVPIRYVVFPRSEVNRVSGASFNRARLDLTSTGVIIRTDEAVEADASIADALYEFTTGLELVKASYSDRYWDMHRMLEAQGKITHTRERCPDRDGPREIDVWDPQTNWRVVKRAETGQK